MNRSRVIHRDFANEGSQDAQALALALAQITDREFLESLLHHVSALREFGGELYIGTARTRVYNGQPVEHNDSRGSFITHAYVVGYTEKSRIKNVPEEPDEPFAAAVAPLPVEEPVDEDLRDEIEAEADPVGT
jgi:hypothetical protein